MVGTTKKTEATTDDTTVATENTNEEVLTAEQAIEAKIEKQFGEEAVVARKKVKVIVDNLGNIDNQLVKGTFTLGYALVETYKGFSIELKKSFWDVMSMPTRSQKTQERAIELVLEQGVKLSEAIDTSGGELDILENEKLLLLDTRVLKLYENNFSKLNKPTLAKVRRMKELKLSQNDWDLICEGKDKLYNKYKNENIEKADKAKAKEILADKPKSIEEAKYLKFVSDNIPLDYMKRIDGLEKSLEYYKNILSKNNLLPKEDSELSSIPTEGKLSIVSESESEEK